MLQSKMLKSRDDLGPLAPQHDLYSAHFPFPQIAFAPEGDGAGGGEGGDGDGGDGGADGQGQGQQGDDGGADQGQQGADKGAGQDQNRGTLAGGEGDGAQGGDKGKGKDQGQQGQGEGQDGQQGQQSSLPSLVEMVADAKHKNVVERFTSVADMAQAIINLRSDNSKRVKVPDEKATDEERAAFFKAIGVPEKPEGYEIKAPEGLEYNDADKAVFERFTPLAHKHGIPKEAFEAFAAELKKLSDDAEAQVNAEIDKAADAVVKQLKKEWGGDYDANVNLANRVSEVLGGAEFKAFLNGAKIEGGGLVGDHPVMTKFLATIGRRMDEGDVMIGATTEEKTSIQQQINELMAKVPPGSAGYTTKAHQDKLQSLYDKLYGREAIVGTEGRAA